MKVVFVCVLVWTLFSLFVYILYINNYDRSIFMHATGSSENLEFSDMTTKNRNITKRNSSAQDNVCFLYGTPANEKNRAKMLKMLPKEYNSLYFRVDLKIEESKSLCGGPGSYLKEYKNPCWLSKLNKVDLYRSNQYRGVYENYKGLQTSFNVGWALKKMKNVYAASHKTWRLRCVPYVYLAGVTKSGTSDLFANLLKHPDIIPAAVKEPTFWNRRRVGHDTSIHTATFSDFVDLFDYAAHAINSTSTEVIREKITIDGTPNYMWDYDGWEKIPGNRKLPEPKYTLPMAIHAVSPGAKIIFILRHPAERLYSHYKMKSRLTSGPDVFHGLVLSALENMINCIAEFGARSCAYNRLVVRNEYGHPGGMFLRASMYSIFVEDWMAMFPKDQLLVVKAENYYENRTQVLDHIFSFLGLKSMPYEKQQERNNIGVINSKNAKPMREDTLKLLNTFLEPFNQRLADILDDTGFLWNDV